MDIIVAAFMASDALDELKASLQIETVDEMVTLLLCCENVSTSNPFLHLVWHGTGGFHGIQG